MTGMSVDQMANVAEPVKQTLSAVVLMATLEKDASVCTSDFYDTLPYDVCLQSFWLEIKRNEV